MNYIPFRLIDLSNNTINNNFENTLFKILQKDFTIFNQEWAKHFCENLIDQFYPDCGEVTARNLINLICFVQNDNLYIEQLSKFQTNEQLIEYYRVFNNFELQSKTDYHINIYGKYLYARDAWSELIIKYAYDGLNFSKSCNNEYGYDLDGGLSKDGNT